MRRLEYLKGVVTLQLDREKCIGCGMCLKVCPQAVIAKDNGAITIENRDACMECGACAMNCPTEALTVQAGVGCAAAVINAALGRTNSCCCISEEQAGTCSSSDGSATPSGSRCC